MISFCCCICNKQNKTTVYIALNTLRSTIREREDTISKLDMQVKDYMEKLNEASRFLIYHTPTQKNQNNKKIQVGSALHFCNVCMCESQTSKLEKSSQQIKTFAEENTMHKNKINSLSIDNSTISDKIERCKYESNFLKEENAQLLQEVQKLRGRIRELTIGVGIESEFPP
ncbi:hypothetical protein RFI_31691, partial [Reticulomyxa filosa]